MGTKLYNFNNSEVQKKATAKAKASKRPKTYYSKKKREEDVKRDLIKAEYLKNGFLEEIKRNIGSIIHASIETACIPESSSTQERKLIFQICSLLDKDKNAMPMKSLANIIAGLDDEESEI